MFVWVLKINSIRKPIYSARLKPSTAWLDTIIGSCQVLVCLLMLISYVFFVVEVWGNKSLCWVEVVVVKLLLYSKSTTSSAPPTPSHGQKKVIYLFIFFYSTVLPSCIAGSHDTIECCRWLAGLGGCNINPRAAGGVAACLPARLRINCWFGSPAGFTPEGSDFWVSPWWSG
jgi:hypothetical protein